MYFSSLIIPPINSYTIFSFLLILQIFLHIPFKLFKSDVFLNNIDIWNTLMILMLMIMMKL